MILRPDPPEDEELEDERYPSSHTAIICPSTLSYSYLSIYQEATDIYGLIHARYIITPKGLAIMRDKHTKGAFGVCSRV